MRLDRLFLFSVAIAFFAPPALRAEEGGSGHYYPGSMSSFVDGVPAEEAVIFRLNLFNYQGGVNAGVTVPIAGMSAVDVDVESTAVGLTALWRPPFGDLTENLSYAAAITVPFLTLRVEADVTATSVPGGATGRRSDEVTGMGDILLLPLMLNYNVSPALNYNFRIAVYTPTGDYEKGALANEGKNFWTIGPMAAVMYLSPETGLEASAFLGFDFNSENDATDYQSGTQGHLEFTLAQHFPLWGGAASGGVSGLWYEQIEGDSGSGAKFGDFKARTTALGPVVSYSRKLSGGDLIGEFKWLHEFDVKRRPEGDSLMLKLLYKF